MALLACSSLVARAAVGEGPSVTAGSPAELLADGCLFGTFLGAMVRLFAPPSEGEGS